MSNAQTVAVVGSHSTLHFSPVKSACAEPVNAASFFCQTMRQESVASMLIPRRSVQFSACRVDQVRVVSFVTFIKTSADEHAFHFHPAHAHTTQCAHCKSQGVNAEMLLAVCFFFCSTVSAVARRKLFRRFFVPYCTAEHRVRRALEHVTRECCAPVHGKSACLIITRCTRLRGGIVAATWHRVCVCVCVFAPVTIVHYVYSSTHTNTDTNSQSCSRVATRELVSKHNSVLCTPVVRCR